jgi:hypothetical protein
MTNLMTRFRLLWDDSRSLQVYLAGTDTIAVWLKFAIMVIHWRGTGVWLR